MLETVTANRVRGDLDVLARAGLGLEDFLVEAVESVRRAVPWVAACISTQDPATHIITSARKYGDLAANNAHDTLFARIEYGSDEPTTFQALHRTGRTGVAMSLATDGETERSLRMAALMRPHYGFWDETRVIFSDGGTYWGTLSLFRGCDDPAFGARELDWLTTLAPLLARGVRAGLVAGAAAAPLPGPVGPAVLILDADDQVVQTSAGAQQRLAGFVADERTADPLTLVTALAGAARRFARGELPAPPRVRVRPPGGDWLLLQASPLSGPVPGSVVITIDDARPAEVTGMLLAALELTARERDVLRLILRGADTKAIAAELFLSPYTVQDHCRAIFEKVGVRSRRELIAQLFQDRPESQSSF